MLHAALLTLLLAEGAATKLAMLPFSTGSGVSTSVTGSLAEAVAAELRRHPGLAVITEQEIRTVLSVSQLEMMLGCSNESCFAEIGGALGADRLVTGSLSKLGRSWLVHIKMIDPKAVRTVGTADRRLKDGDIDDVLDQLPAMIAELVGGGAPAPAPPADAAPPPAAGPLPPAWAAIRHADAGLLSRLTLLADGADHYVAVERTEKLDAALFAGDGSQLFEQRVFGRSKDGAGGFDYTFWEPRVAQRWQGGFGRKNGAYALQCGERSIAYQVVPEAAAKKLLAKIVLHAPRWQRQAHAIARDEWGTYYYVDRAREPEDSRDFRLFVGPKGKLAHHPVNDAIIDEAGQIFLAASGRLAMKRDGSALWSAGGREVKLVVLEPYTQAPMIYRELGAYSGQRLCTACDPFLE